MLSELFYLRVTAIPSSSTHFKLSLKKYMAQNFPSFYATESIIYCICIRYRKIYSKTIHQINKFIRIERFSFFFVNGLLVFFILRCTMYLHIERKCLVNKQNHVLEFNCNELLQCVCVRHRNFPI